MHSRRRSGIGYRKKRSFNFLPPLLLLGGVALVAYLGWKLFSLLFLGGNAVQAVSAEILLHKGRAEFQLEGNVDWAPTYSEQLFYEGDLIKTRANSRAGLSVGGSTFFLDENTSIKLVALYADKADQKHVEIDLLEGRLWSKVSDELIGQKSPHFILQTPNSLVQGADVIFDMESSTESDVIRVIDGEIQLQIPTNEEKTENRNVKVGVGQKAEVVVADLMGIASGKNILAAVETPFEESEWNLNNLEAFDPQRVAELRRVIEIKAPKIQEPTVSSSSDPKTVEASITTGTALLPAPIFSSPSPGSVVSATEDDFLVISGTTSGKTKQMKLKSSLQNAYYTLQKYEAGKTTWQFVIAKEYGSLKHGDNVIYAQAVDETGKGSPVAELKFSYDGAKDDILSASTAPVVGGVDLDEFAIKPPVISNPPSSPFQTASSVLTISGSVDLGTLSVEVNGFKLKNFQPKNTKFQYIANAEYGNMKEGVNEYVITAFGPGSEKASTKIVVVYTPIKTDVPDEQETTEQKAEEGIENDVVSEEKTDETPLDALDDAYKDAEIEKEAESESP